MLMTLHHPVRQQLLTLEALMRDRDLWQSVAPDISAFDSDQPFRMDTLAPFEWLQALLR